MCQDCGCSIVEESKEHQEAHKELHHNPQLNEEKTLNVIKRILDKNDHQAFHNKEHFNRENVLGINIMSSPGSGKTALLESLSEVSNFKFGVVEGDLETNRDKERLEKKGIEATQIQTGSACHLDAFMVHSGLHHLNLKGFDVCFIENVGNLVCPASYELGTHLNIVLLSTPEGADKIAKYPVMFHKADLIIFTKIDLIEHFDFDIEKEKQDALKLNPKVEFLEVSTKDKKSIEKVALWVEGKRDVLINSK